MASLSAFVAAALATWTPTSATLPPDIRPIIIVEGIRGGADTAARACGEATPVTLATRGSTEVVWSLWSPVGVVFLSDLTPEHTTLLAASPEGSLACASTLGGFEILSRPVSEDAPWVAQMTVETLKVLP